MTSKTKATILGGGAIAMTALGLAMLRWTSAAAPAAEAPRAAAPGAPAARHGARVGLPRRQWSAGATYVYEIASTRALAMRRGAGPGQSRALALSGRLSISVVGPAPDGAGSQLRLALNEIAPAGAGAALAGDAARLARAFYAVAEPSGQLASFAFPRGITGAERATLKGLASALQVVVPDPAAAAWRATEQDTSGEYEAAYDAYGAAVHKAKERYVRARGPRGLAPIRDPSAYAVASSIDFELDGSGWPRTASEDETLTVTAGSMRVEARTRTTARLAAVEQTADLARIVAAEAPALTPEPEADEAGFASARRRADEGLVDGASYRTLLGDFASADVKLRNHTIARMAALFRIQPDTAPQAAGAILRGELAAETTQRLIGALGGAGTAEAQRALASVLGADQASPETRSDAAAALGMTKQPTDASKQALIQAAGSSDPALASTAAMGLGNLIKRMDEQGSGDPSDAITALIQRLAGAADDAERTQCLDALGNSGDPRALSAIEPYLASDAVPVRAAAVEALRFMAGTDDRIAVALQDLAAQVRRAAAGALAYRAITPMLALVTATLEHDADVDTRLQLVTALKLRKREEPLLAELLAWAAAHDPAEEVRSAAQSAVGSPV
jgi:hypothetical protein